MLDSAFVTPGWMTSQEYFTGIALIQAMPGPLFNISAYIGAGCLSSCPALPWMFKPQHQWVLRHTEGLSCCGPMSCVCGLLS